MMTSRRGIVTGGTWCVDRNRAIDAWPHEDGVAEILATELHGGGSACNLAIDIKKLDPNLPVATIGLVGDDEDGRFLLTQADAYGIERSRIAVTREAATQFTDAYVSQRSGRRTHIFFQGTGALLTPRHFDFSGISARIFHLGLPGAHQLMDQPHGEDANGWVSVLRRAQAAGLVTNLELFSISPERIAALVRPCLPHLDYLIVNDFEIGALAGIRTAQDGATVLPACIEAARHVLAAGAMRLVVVHFPAGAIALSRDGGTVSAASVNVPLSEVVSANGAGDAFAAGLLYALHEGWEVLAALELAHASAAMSLRALSTCASVETYQACLAQARKWGSRAA
ncbi:carbohydrate kinase family protein [Dongia sp.]|uniref:carbohydrate kinase family protein n=1 Tax=Dongia sp. TaxID=1977262 RepID=UPI0035ADF96E